MSSQLLGRALLFSSLLFGSSNVHVYGAITTKVSGNYIGIYDDTNVYTPNTADDYCQLTYGTSLASIHSATDESDVFNAFIVEPVYNGVITFIGAWDESQSNQVCNGLAELSWRDGSTYDYDIRTESYWPQGNAGKDMCGEYCVIHWCWPNSDNCGWEDLGCTRNFNNRGKQFVCNYDGNTCIDFDIGDECQDPINDECTTCDNNCNVCNNNLCSQCSTGYFKASNNHACVSCNQIFGDGCLFCQDNNGCGQCDSSAGYDRVYNEDCDLYYCQENPCFDSNNHCSVCNNGLCSQCETGYILKNMDDTSCSHCQTEFGSTCLHCSNFIGCQQCQDESMLYQDQNDAFYKCYES